MRLVEPGAADVEMGPVGSSSVSGSQGCPINKDAGAPAEEEAVPKRRPWGKNDKGGLAKPLRQVLKHLRDAREPLLWQIFLMSKHAHRNHDKLPEAHRLLQKYATVRYYNGHGQAGIHAGTLANLCGCHALEAFHRNAEALKRLEEIQKIVINQKVDACLRGRGAVGSARSTRGTKRPSEALKAAYQ